MENLGDKIEIQKLTKEQGFGYYLARPGEILNRKYEVKRLVGLGTASSVFLCLALEADTKEYVAVKILTADATDGNKQGVLREAEIMQAITDLPENGPLPSLLDNFEIEGVHGLHLCLVMNTLSPDLNAFRTTAPNMALPIHTVKLVIAEMLEGLNILHQAGIIHTDVKADNVFFDGPDVKTVENDLSKNPVIVKSNLELNGKVYPIMGPQPLPHQHKWDDDPFLVELYGIHLADFSHAVWKDGEKKMSVVGSESLRAPEVILQTGYGPEIDIWAIGCTAFEMLTGRWLFKPDVEEGDPWTVEDDLLAKMMELTGERFANTKIFTRSPEWDRFFDANGNLRRIDTLIPVTFEDALKNYGTLKEEDAAAAAKFITECLHLDPADRWTAKQLLEHPWMYRGPPPSCNGAKFG